MSAWQPIETAPKDGTEFLAIRSGRNFPYTCRWDDDEFALIDERGAYVRAVFPAYWQPLPAPPSDQEAS